jgi:F-type H+-transporting ATPase subunit delta
MNTATAARLADIYARSLLDLTKESRTVEAIAADLEAVSTLLAQQPGLEAFLASPYFAEQTKRDLIREVFTGRLDRTTVNFLSVMIDHNRGTLLPKVLGRFRQLYRVYQGYESVAVTVAQSPSPEQFQKLARELAEAMRAKIDLEVLVDPSILGGVIIRHGDKLLDNSIRGRLTRTVRQVANPENRHKKTHEDRYQ